MGPIIHFSENIKQAKRDLARDLYQNLRENCTVLEEIWEGSSLNHTEIRSLLATFLFKGNDVFKEVRVLSGGERARLVLAKLMQKKVNLLLLDEPTNHLDIESREALEEALLSFEGTVIAVSHDRYFIRKIAKNILNFEGNASVYEYRGDYDSFCEYRSRRETPILAATPTVQKESESQAVWEKQKKNKQEERKRKARIRKIEEEISASESRISEIDELAAAITSDYVKLQELYDEKARLESRCNELLEEWTVLEEV